MQCGECTECCELLEVKSLKATKGLLIDLITIDTKAGEMCPYCEKNKGCKVYDDRPTICRTFFCAYSQQEEISINLRPDKCGIIFEKLDDTLFLGTVRPNVNVSEEGMNQIKVFNQQGFDVVLIKYDTIKPFISCAEGNDEFNVLKKFLHFKKIASSNGN